MLGGGGAGKTEAESWEKTCDLRKDGSSFSQGLVQPHWEVQQARAGYGPCWATPGLEGPFWVPPPCWGRAEGLDLGWGPGGV